MTDLDKILKNIVSKIVQPSELTHLYQVRKFLDNTIDNVPFGDVNETCSHMLKNTLLLRDSLQKLILENEVKLRTLQEITNELSKVNQQSVPDDEKKEEEDLSEPGQESE